MVLSPTVMESWVCVKNGLGYETNECYEYGIYPPIYVLETMSKRHLIFSSNF